MIPNIDGYELAEDEYLLKIRPKGLLTNYDAGFLTKFTKKGKYQLSLLIGEIPMFGYQCNRRFLMVLYQHMSLKKRQEKGGN